MRLKNVVFKFEEQHILFSELLKILIKIMSLKSTILNCERYNGIKKLLMSERKTHRTFDNLDMILRIKINSIKLKYENNDKIRKYILYAAAHWYQQKQRKFRIDLLEKIIYDINNDNRDNPRKKRKIFMNNVNNNINHNMLSEMKVDVAEQSNNDDLSNDNDVVGNYVMELQLHEQPVLSEMLSTEKAISLSTSNQ